jgi:hypothetical protein
LTGVAINDCPDLAVPSNRRDVVASAKHRSRALASGRRYGVAIAASISPPVPVKVPLSTSSATLRNVKSDVAAEAELEVCGSEFPQPYGDVM